MSNLSVALAAAATVLCAAGSVQAAGLNQMNASLEQCRDGLRDAPIAEAGPYCAGLETEAADKARAPRLTSLKRGWSPADLAAYDAFAAKRSVFLAGEGRDAVLRIAPQRAMYAAIAAQDDDLSLMTAFSTGSGPEATASELAKADQELNALYQRLTGGPEVTEQNWGLTPTGLNASQRAWRAYRDAWLEFAGRKWPHANLQGLVAHLTVQRSTTLACLLADMDAGETYEQRCNAPSGS